MPTMPFWLVVWLILPTLAAQGEPGPASTAAASRLVDRVVAVVDGDPILLSDLRRAVAFDPTLEPLEAESEEETLRRALDELVRERIRFHAVDRAGAGVTDPAEIQALAEATRSRFPTEVAFLAELTRHGMTERELEGMLARRQAIFNFVNDRLRSQVFVDATEIQTYFDSVLVPQVEAAGGQPPTLDSKLREAIRAAVTEIKLNEEEERWLRELESKADVVLLWEPPTARSEPRIHTLGLPPPP